MAFFIRKAYKFGPIRMNLSKSGVGFSAGVTGARVGINSRGQRYVAGGRHGLYYRKNVSSGGSKRSQGISNLRNVQASEEYNSSNSKSNELNTDLPGEKWLYWGASLLFFFLTFAVHWTFLFGSFLSLFAMGISSVNRKRKFLEWKRLLEGEWNHETIDKIQTTSAELSRYSQIYDNHIYYLLDGLVTRIAEDKQFDDSEKQVLRILFQYSQDSGKKAKITQLLGLIATEYALDHSFSSEEKEFLESALIVFGVEGEELKNFENLIQYFDTLDKIRDAEKLEPIQPSVAIASTGENIYWEVEMDVLNPKSRTVRESGKIFLSDSYIHIFTQGHRKIKWDDVLHIEIADPFSESFDITIKNRKTPLIISCKNALMAYTIIAKLRL